jgi:hypothetical protein
VGVCIVQSLRMGSKGRTDPEHQNKAWWFRRWAWIASEALEGPPTSSIPSVCTAETTSPLRLMTRACARSLYGSAKSTLSD